MTGGRDNIFRGSPRAIATDGRDAAGRSRPRTFENGLRTHVIRSALIVIIIICDIASYTCACVHVRIRARRTFYYNNAIAGPVDRIVVRFGASPRGRGETRPASPAYVTRSAPSGSRRKRPRPAVKIIELSRAPDDAAGPAISSGSFYRFFLLHIFSYPEGRVI